MEEDRSGLAAEEAAGLGSHPVESYTSFVDNEDPGADGVGQDDASAPVNNSLLARAALDNALGFVPCLICIAVLSVIYTISAIVICANSCKDWPGYATIWAICAGLLSTTTCISVAIIVSIAPKINLNIAPMLDSTKKSMSIGLTGLWFVAVVVGTFYAPFPSTDEANGYLAVWASFFLSIYMFCDAFGLTAAGTANSAANMASQMRMTREMLFGLLILFFASLVELTVSSIMYFELANAVNFLVVSFPLPAYGVSVGVISLVTVMAMIAIQIFVPKKEATVITMVMGLFLSLWWLIAIMILTNSIFQTLGNGYFSAYMALGASLYVVAQCEMQKTFSKLMAGLQSRPTGANYQDTASPGSDVAYNAYEDEDEGGTDF